jgi:hypothetical protein
MVNYSLVLGGFSPKESIYDEVSPSSSTESALQFNEFAEKPLDGRFTSPYFLNMRK